MQQQFYQLTKLWNVCTFVTLKISKFRREIQNFYWKLKIWDLGFILIRNKIFILRRSEAVSRDSCQLAIRWHLHDNVGWIEINKIEFGYLFLTLIYRHFACASCLKLDLYDFLIFPLIMGRRRTSDGDLSSFIYLKDRFGQRTVNI